MTELAATQENEHIISEVIAQDIKECLEEKKQGAQKIIEECDIPHFSFLDTANLTEDEEFARLIEEKQSGGFW